MELKRKHGGGASKKAPLEVETHPQDYYKNIPRGNNPKQRLIIFTPTTGLVRIEWVQARYGQVIPTNWSMHEVHQFIHPFAPIEHQLADAQNLLAKKVVMEDAEWVLFIEHDNLIPFDFFVKMNAYMNEAKYPMVSGLYFTKSIPPEPILYRGRGNSYFGDWKLGDKVWVDGVPFGALLVHGSLIKEAWKISEEYQVPGTNEITKRVFATPLIGGYTPEHGYASMGGTTDLAWCTRLMDQGILKKAGWPSIATKKHPYLVDTSMFVWHIDELGRKFPLYLPEDFITRRITFNEIGAVKLADQTKKHQDGGKMSKVR